MTDEDDRRAQQRQRGLDYINSEAGAASAEALGAILEAVEGEWEVKTDGTQAAVDTRADFQSAALTALRKLLFALGLSTFFTAGWLHSLGTSGWG
jgi:hypothetical protein